MGARHGVATWRVIAFGYGQLQRQRQRQLGAWRRSRRAKAPEGGTDSVTDAGTATDTATDAVTGAVTVTTVPRLR